MSGSWGKCLLFLCLLGFGIVKAQHSALYQTDEERQRCLDAVETIVAAYNVQDFARMQQPLFVLGRILVSKASLQKEFEPYFLRYGAAAVDTVSIASRYEYSAALRFAKVPGHWAYMRFLFNEKGKVEGFGFAQPTLVYRKTESAPESDTGWKAKVDSLVLRAAHPQKGQALSGCVRVQEQGEVYERCIGYCRQDSLQPIDRNTAFEIASCSKQFTAMAILLLAERRQLGLDEPVTRYLEGFPYPAITVRHLLAHTSGLPDYEALLQQHWNPDSFATNDAVLSLLQHHRPKPHFTPNTQFEYSNTGYVVLASIVAKVSGKSYNAFLQDEIFSPLEMHHTRVYNDRRSKGVRLDNMAYGYVWEQKNGQGQAAYQLPDSLASYRKVIYQEPIVGDGSVYASIDDLGKWMAALRNSTLLPMEGLEAALSRHVLNDGSKVDYGFGFFIGGGKGAHRIAYHTGGWPGYLCILLWFRDIDRSVMILTNNSYDNFLVLTDRIARVLNGD